MVQFARPDSDIIVGGWTPTPLWQQIDEVSPDDGDLVSSSNNPANDLFEVSLTNISDPDSSTGHIVRYRYRKSASGGRVISLRARLLQGATEIASWTDLDIQPSFVQPTQTLSAAQADAITNYNDLRFEFRANDDTGSGPGRRADVSWAEFEVPDAPTPDFGWFIQGTDIVGVNIPILAPSSAFVQVVAASAPPPPCSNPADCYFWY